MKKHKNTLWSHLGGKTPVVDKPKHNRDNCERNLKIVVILFALGVGGQTRRVESKVRPSVRCFQRAKMMMGEVRKNCMSLARYLVEEKLKME